MKFEEALVHFRKGKSIRHPRWPAGYYDKSMKDSFINVDDILAEDWELFNEPSHDSQDIQKLAASLLRLIIINIGEDIMPNYIHTLKSIASELNLIIKD